MSVPSIYIECEKCNERWSSSVSYGLHKYQLPTGQQSWMNKKLAWCYDCASFEPVEVLPTEEELVAKHTEASAKLAKILAEPKGIRGLLKRRYSSKYKERVQLAQRATKSAAASLAWYALRESPAHCLSCGSSNPQYLNYTQPGGLDGFPHPDCGGELACKISDIYYAWILNTKIYDVEGNLMESRRETKGDTELTEAMPSPS